MLIGCWSPKGGSGTSVVAGALALSIAQASSTGSLLVDLTGDQELILGIDPGAGGLSDWCDAYPAVAPGALSKLEQSFDERLSFVARGKRELTLNADSAGDLARELKRDGRPVIADLGSGAARAGECLQQNLDLSVVVLRPCYLALRKAAADAHPIDAVVLIEEVGRSLRKVDVEAALGVRVAASLEVDPRISRAVDAGILARRLPKHWAKALRRVA